MPQFQIKHIESFHDCVPSQGIFLWILHATKIPPHVGISLDGQYFSLKMNGIDDLAIEQVLKIMLKKEIPSVLVKLKENQAIYKRFLTVKNTYERIIPEKTTCLSPISELLLSDHKDYLLPELLETLSLQGQIESFFGLNLPSEFTGLISYEKQQVSKRLIELKDAKRTNYIPQTH